MLRINRLAKAGVNDIVACWLCFFQFFSDDDVDIRLWETTLADFLELALGARSCDSCEQR